MSTGYIYKTTVKNTYGLTDAWIARIGAPDKIVQNPYYRTRKSQLYLRARVEAFIDAHKDEYEKLIAGREARRGRAQKVADRRARELVEWAETVSIEMRALPNLYALKKETTDQYMRFALDRGRDCTEFTMSRAALVAHVRHCLTNYEDILSQAEGKAGRNRAYLVIRERCDELIEDAFSKKYGLTEA